MTQENDEHIIEAIGRSRIVIRNGRVVEVGEAQITDCPLAKRFAYPIPAITKDSIKMNIEHRIKAFGMCTGKPGSTGQPGICRFRGIRIVEFRVAGGNN